MILFNPLPSWRRYFNRVLSVIRRKLQQQRLQQWQWFVLLYLAGFGGLLCIASLLRTSLKLL